MKIVELRFKNLNSLYGEWLIDFTAPDYENNGIFALTGPTGAGKSTILDAICLALYGATPRLGRITATTNDIMSRQSGECFAEVVFISQAGEFRCRWDQRRARKAPLGNLQNQEHQISEAQTGKLIENKVSRVPIVVEEKTGMDFERFTRSVLLAQGSFDTFLKADAEQKSTLLEQITGTEIYTEISKRVHERLRQEQAALNGLLMEIAAIGVLDVEEERALQHELKQKELDYHALNTQLEVVTAALEWLATLTKLDEEIKCLEEQYGAVELKQQRFNPSRQRLTLAVQAAVLDGEYAELRALKKQQENEQVELNDATRQLPQLRQKAEQQAEQNKMAAQKLIKAKQALQEARPVLQQVRALDQQLPKPFKQMQYLSCLPLAEVTQALSTEKKKIAQWLQGRLLREYEQDKEALWREKVLLTKIAQLEEERALLEAGTPCPLCGATAHPYVHGHIPEMDEVDQKMNAIDRIIRQVHASMETIQDLELAELMAKRREMYGSEDPDQQERHLLQAIEKAERLEQQARENHTVLQQNYVVLQAKLDTLLQRISLREADLEKAQKKLKVAIKQGGFDDEAAFIAARLSASQRETLTSQALALDNEVLSLSSRLQDRQARLQVEQKKQITTVSQEQLLLQQQEYALGQQQLHERLVQLRFQLKKNREAKHQVQAKQLLLEAQQKECVKWEQLHALIGSADGKKYRNFAQGLTFELMIKHANQQLDKMTDRYLLKHDATQPLSLNVIDGYQAGEIRSTKNLSGGESFIVSLSLALGLSKMASRKVRVDSLFLDEGFGTLDEDALDMALGTLANLQQEGKLIGVISHVPALKERIATQIRVVAVQGGRSRIQGPGCYSL